MKNLIIKNLKKMKSNIYDIEIIFKNIEDTIISMGFYNSKYKKLVKNLLFLDQEVKFLEQNFIKLEEAICHFLKKW